MSLFKNKYSLLIGIFLGIVVLIFLNIAISREINRPKDISQAPPAPSIPVVSKPKMYVHEEVTREAMLEPNRQYSESVLFIKGEEVARYKNDGEKILETKGNIPDGLVKFKDFSRNSYGTEYYKDGKKHGELKEHYSNGQLRRESTYQYGKMVTNKEYFFDGKLRMDEDFSDAIEYSESKDTGTGKMYFRDGKIMYEWHITNLDNNRYTKAYNVAGEVTQIEYFDSGGKLLSRIDYRKQAVVKTP